MKTRPALPLAILFLTFYLYLTARPLLLPWINLPGFPDRFVIAGHTLVFFLFSLAHAFHSLGWRNALGLMAWTLVVGWGMEQLGVLTGWVYGSYHYTELLGPKLGDVPVLIPLSWYMMIYPAYVIANCIAGIKPVGSEGGWGRLIVLTVLSALAMTSRDLIIDPQMSGQAVQAWIWEQGGVYFGVPAMNFLGWIVTCLLVYFPYRLVERRFAPQPEGALTRWIVSMPLAMHALILVTALQTASLPALKVIGPFAVGPLVLIAASRLWLNVPDAPLAESRTGGDLIDAR